MGAVYLAREAGREFAIKTLALGREFGGEAQAEARRDSPAKPRRPPASHPDIVTVFERGEEQGLAWIAMEFLPGRDLGHYTQADACCRFRRCCASPRAWPRRWPTRTARASCTATSSRPT